MALDEATVVRELWRQRIHLLAYIEVIVHDEHLAEDVFQEVSVAAVQKRAEIHDATHLERWLMQAARFHGVAAVRKSARRPMVFDDGLLDRIEGAWNRPDAAEMFGQADALKTCLERLSPYARRLIELRYAQGISGPQLAETVGRKLNTIYVALTRTHRALAECVRTEMTADRPSGRDR